MNLIILGPPGAGKGTQAKLIAAKHNLIQLSTGDMLRSAVEAGGEFGEMVRGIMERGDLVPDDVVIRIIEKRITERTGKSGFIFDGFPRTLAQADALDTLLKSKRKRIDLAIELRVDDAALIERISGRFSCAKCGAGYHDTFKRPAREGVCDVCGATQFTRRADDNAETVKNRLLAYYKATAPLIGYYFAKRILKSVDGMPPIEEVSGEIDRVLGVVAA